MISKQGYLERVEQGKSAIESQSWYPGLEIVEVYSRMQQKRIPKFQSSDKIFRDIFQPH